MQPKPKSDSGPLVFMIVALVVAGGLAVYFMTERSSDRRASEIRNEMKQHDQDRREAAERDKRQKERDEVEDQRRSDDREAARRLEEEKLKALKYK